MGVNNKSFSIAFSGLATTLVYTCLVGVMTGCQPEKKPTNQASSVQADTVAERAAILHLLARENETFCNRDYDGWAATWVHEPFTLKTYTGPGLYSEYSGWHSIDSLAKDYFRQHPKPDALPTGQQQWQVRLMGKAAWVTFEQQDDRRGRKKEIRLLEKQGSDWKIAVMGTVYQQKR